MLKWLRKYNTFILVVGGCLLMVAFLLQGTLDELGKRGWIGASAFQVGGHKVGLEEFGNSAREYSAVSYIAGGARELEAFFRIEGAEHWYLLVKEAEEAGLVGGKLDGEDYLAEIPAIIAGTRARFDFRVPYDQILSYERARIEASKLRVMSETRLTEDQLFKAVARLHGIRRLQASYYGASQFGEKRLVTEGRELTDALRADYVLIPAEREMAAIAEPDEAAIKAHYEKFKDIPKGGGEFGIGYTLPPRVKLSWIEINRQLIADAVRIDEIEAEKRFQQKYPNGVVPEGKNADDERARFEAEVRTETADRAMKTAIDAVRGEIDKATRKLDREGEFLRVTPEWETIRPDFQKIREVVAAHLLEQYKIVVSPTRVVVRANSWVDAQEAQSLEGIGHSAQQRGQSALPFSKAVFEVREIAGRNDLALQVGVPVSEPFRSGGNAYFFVVLDARKESPPDSMEDVRADIVRNVKRLAAYEILKANESRLLAEAISGGLEALTRSPEGTPAVSIGEVNVSKKRTVALEPSLDTQEFRDTALAAASNLDPTVDPTTLPADKRTFATPVPKSLSLFVGRIKGLQPLTLERYRSQQDSILANVQADEFTADMDAFPYSLEVMEKRLDVQYEESREKARAEQRAEKAAARQARSSGR